MQSCHQLEPSIPGHRSSQASFHVSFPVALPALAAQKQRAHLAGCSQPSLRHSPVSQYLPGPVFWSHILTQKTADLPMEAPYALGKWFTPILDHSMEAAQRAHLFSKGGCNTKLSSSMDFPKCSSSWCTHVFSWQWVALGNPSSLRVATSKDISFSTFPSPPFFFYMKLKNPII